MGVIEKCRGLFGPFARRLAVVERGPRLAFGGLAIGLVIVAIATLLDQSGQGSGTLSISKTEAQAPHEPQGAEARNVTQRAPPMAVTLFGERVPLENWEVRERFEREFYYNFSNADQILLDWKRGGRYFPRIEKALADAGIPSDFKYLMVAESGLKNVKSPASANGFWQFIAGTAMRYGLRVDDYIDERLDPDIATAAAIKYFQKMKSELPSWTLVAAGYNMGEDNVKVAMEWQHQTNYWNMFVNDETMRYLLRIAAIKELMEHGERYGLDFSRTIPFRDPQVRTMTVQGPIPSISDWAQQQGLSYKDVKVFNPSLIGRSLPAGTFILKLPATDGDRATVSAQ